jgi:mRNA interferase RelE/StbE
MAWTIEFSDAGQKALDRLSAREIARIVDFLINRVANHPSPRSLAIQMVGYTNRWRFRVGDYRIIARFEDDKLLVIVIDVGHRSSIYQR